jgi:hypothetical protein
MEKNAPCAGHRRASSPDTGAVIFRNRYLCQVDNAQYRFLKAHTRALYLHSAGDPQLPRRLAPSVPRWGCGCRNTGGAGPAIGTGPAVAIVHPDPAG